MKALALTLLSLTALALEAKTCAAELPLCKDAWKGQRTAYDFKESYSNYIERLKRTDCQKEWAVLVYMAADNNLFPFALWDLYEMESAFQTGNLAGSTPKTDVIVEVDGPASDDLRRLHIQSGPVVYREKQKDDFQNSNLEEVQSPVIARIPEKEDKSEQQRLENFLSWAAKNYPARHTMLVIWGHGQGWKSYPIEENATSRLIGSRAKPNFPERKPDKNFGGIAFRESSGTWLNIPALASALRKFQQTAGHPLDVYASDACLMQMLEVSFEIGDSARFVVGSAQVQSFLGLPYRRLLYELNSGHFNGLRNENRESGDGNDEPYLLAKMIPSLMKASLNLRGGGLQSGLDREAFKSMTSSAISIEEMTRLLIPEITQLSEALRGYLTEDPSRAMELRYVTQNVPLLEGSAQDFGVFLGFLDELLHAERDKNGGELSAGALKLSESVQSSKQALDRSVLSYVYGSNYGIDEKSRLVGYVPRAVSIWLPVNAEEFRKRRYEFQSSRFYKATKWQAWLDILFPN